VVGSVPAYWCHDLSRVKRLFSFPIRKPRTTPPMLATLEAYVQQIVEFVRLHEVWAAPIVFALAFGESLAFISLLVPAWGALVAIGYLIGPSGISFWPVCVAGALGAALGDWLSYWVGLKVGPPVAHVWPLSRHPDLLPRGERFMSRWGIPGIFIGRFFGPLRASVPLVAGILAMPYWRFQFANFTSAFVWAAVLLTLGDGISTVVKYFWN
jgi:membrane protein DedA with SNARE-associated domain